MFLAYIIFAIVILHIAAGIGWAVYKMSVNPKSNGKGKETGD